MGNKIAIIYHKEDNDGVFSCALAYKYLVKNLQGIDEDSIDLFGVTNTNINELDMKGWKSKYFSVVMLDISFNSKVKMNKLYKDFGENFIWIDHHSSSINKSHHNPYLHSSGLRSTRTSAIGLAYQFFWDQLRIFEKNGKMPKILQYLAGWDCWNSAQYGLHLDDCYGVNLAINKNVRLDVHNALELLDEIMDEDGATTNTGVSKLDGILNEAKIIMEYDEYRFEQLMNDWVDDSWIVDMGNGRTRKAAVLFTQGITSIRMFNSIAEKIDTAVIIKKLPNSNKYRGSIYNMRGEDADEYDLGKWLSSMNVGGGHANAAGFTISKSRLNKWLSTKLIVF